MGAWSFVNPRFDNLIGVKVEQYIHCLHGRKCLPYMHVVTIVISYTPIVPITLSSVVTLANKTLTGPQGKQF